MSWTWPYHTHGRTKDLVGAICWELAEYGDVIDPLSGQGTARLMQRVQEHWGIEPASTSFPNLLKEMAGGSFGHCITREIHGRRTKAIRLVLGPEDMPPRPSNGPVAPYEPADEPIVPRRIEEPDDEPIVPHRIDQPDDDDIPDGNEPDEDAVPDDDDWDDDPYPWDDGGVFAAPDLPATATVVDRVLLIQRLCTDVLLDVAQLAARAASAADPVEDETAERLAAALDDSARLRRHLREAKEVAAARAHEATSLRRSLSQVQANLDALRTGAMANDEGFRALDRIMRQAPTRRDTNGHRLPASVRR